MLGAMPDAPVLTDNESKVCGVNLFYLQGLRHLQRYAGEGDLDAPGIGLANDAVQNGRKPGGVGAHVK